MEIHRTLLDEKLAESSALAARLDGKQVFIAGASGFLASSLVAFLDALRKKYAIQLTIRASARRPTNGLPLWRYMGVVPAADVQQADVESTELPDEDMILVHAASYGAPADYMREPMATFRANTAGVCALLDQPHSSRIRHFVFISSAEVYGQPPPESIPTPEDYAGHLPTTQARSIYGESKRMGETLCVSLCESRGIPLTILRPWNIYGPGQRYEDSRVPMQFMRQCRETSRLELLSDGSPVRSFCYAWDGIAQIAASLSEPSAPLNVFNIGNGFAEISIRRLAEACLSCCGLPPSNLKLGSSTGGSAISHSCPDVRRILAALPGQPRWTPLDSGLKALMNWTDFLSRSK